MCPTVPDRLGHSERNHECPPNTVGGPASRGVCELMFVQDLKDLEMKLETAGAWGRALLKELGPPVGGDRDTPVS